MKVMARWAPILLSALITSTTLQVAIAQETTPPGAVGYQEVAGLLAEDSRERNAVENVLADIRSSADLAEYLRVTPPERNPLSRLTPLSRQRFVRSLTFNENGVTGFNYRPLSDELSVSEIYRVLSLFGMQHITARIPDARVETPVDEAIMRQVSPQFCPPVEPESRGPDASPQGQCPVDYPNYKCVGRATCQIYNGFICTHNC